MSLWSAGPSWFFRGGLWSSLSWSTWKTCTCNRAGGITQKADSHHQGLQIFWVPAMFTFSPLLNFPPKRLGPGGPSTPHPETYSWQHGSYPSATVHTYIWECLAHFPLTRGRERRQNTRSGPSTPTPLPSLLFYSHSLMLEKGACSQMSLQSQKTSSRCYKSLWPSQEPGCFFLPLAVCWAIVLHPIL